MKTSLIALIACLLITHPALAQTPRVLEVAGATMDAYEMASWGDRLVVATSGGVVFIRSGRIERVLTVRDGLPGLRFRSVSVVGNSVWLGGIDGAARIALDDTGTLRVAEHLAIPRVQRVVQWRDTLYIATAGQGLLRVSPVPVPVPVLSPIPLGHSPAFMHITDLAVQGDALWISTAGAGVLRLSSRGRIDRRVGPSAGLPSALAFRLALDGDRLIVATAEGIAVLRRGRVDPTAPETTARGDLPVPDVRGLSVTTQGLVVSTYGAGVFRFDRRAAHYARVGDSAPAAARDVLARVDGVYVSHAGGLTRVAPDGTVTASLDAGLPSSDLTCLAEAFGSLWIGTFDHGLARRDTDGTLHAVTEAHARWSVDLRINDLARTRDVSGETLWIATDRGLYAHDGRSFVPAIDPRAPGHTHVTALHVDADGDLWVAGSEGLFHREPRTGAWSHFAGDRALPMQPLGAVTRDARGIVWAGGLHGLFTLDPTTGHIARHTVSRGDLPVDWVTAVAPFDRGIVAGTYHGGVVWSDGARFDIEREGTLPSGWVNPHALRVIDGTVWFGALDRGLVVGNRGHWTALTLARGLGGNDVTAVLPAGDGTTWVASRGGLARIAVR